MHNEEGDTRDKPLRASLLSSAGVLPGFRSVTLAPMQILTEQHGAMLFAIAVAVYKQ